MDHDHPSSIPGQYLHRLPALAHEDEQRARSRLGAHPLADQRAQALAAQAHVHRLQSDVDRQAVIDHVGPPLSAATTARSSSASKPGFTEIVAAPIRTSTEDVGAVARIS